MRKFILALLMAAVIPTYAYSKEKITIAFSANPSQPNAPVYIKMLDIANKNQDKYEFSLEFKPGAQGVIAIKYMDQSPTDRLATIAPAYVENVKTGAINEADYVPVVTQGDACWAVITNVGDTKKGLASLKGQKEIVVGGTGFGNAAHLTALMIGEKYGFNVRYVVYKANYDALVNMTGGENINFVLERVASYQGFKTANPNLQILGINCSERHPLMPEVKTLKEQGFNTPTIFMATIANVKMPAERRKEIAAILDRAQAQMGAADIVKMSDMHPPMFAKNKQTTEQFFNDRVNQMKYLTSKYQDQIKAAKQ